VSVNDSIFDLLVKEDKYSQESFYKANYSRLMLVILRYVSNESDAKIVINDSFMKIFKSFKTLNDASKILPWTASIARYTALDYVRKSIKYESKHIEIEENHTVTLNRALESLSIDEILRQIHSLKDKERIVFSMYAIDGYKHREISDILNISEGTSKWYLNQARNNLMQLLKSYNHGG